MSSDIDLLREENERLRQENAALRVELEHLQRVDAERQATVEVLQSQWERMREQLALFRKALFAPRRERFIPSPDQKLLFHPEPLDGEKSPADEASAAAPPAEPRPRRPRKKKRQRFVFPQCLPVKRVEYPLSPEELADRYGEGPWRVLKELVTRRLELTPASAYVLEEVRFVYAAEEPGEGPAIVTSEKPATINEKGVFGPTAIAYLADAKFERHLPLYRLQEELRSITTMWFGRGVLCSTLLRAAEQLLPLRDLMLSLILRSCFLRVDETTGRVLRPGTGKTGQIYQWIYAGDEPHPYLVFDYRLDRSRDGPAEILRDYAGGLLTDGYGVYTSLVRESAGRMFDLGCWAHARRKFDESCLVTSNPVAHEALAWIWQLYDIEDRYIESTPAERLAARQRESVPVLWRLKERLDAARPTVRPSLKLAEAMGYVTNRWDALMRYTSDGRYAIDNNLPERGLRPPVIGRKNYLFFGSDDGGRAASVWYTLIQSARANHVHVLPYLHDVLVRLPRIVPEYLRVGDAPTPFDALTVDQLAALTALLPDRWLQEHPECRCVERQRELEEANRRRHQRRALRRRALSA